MSKLKYYCRTHFKHITKVYCSFRKVYRDAVFVRNVRISTGG